MQAPFFWGGVCLARFSTLHNAHTVQCTLYSMYTLGIKRGSFTDFRHYFFSWIRLIYTHNSWSNTFSCTTRDRRFWRYFLVFLNFFFEIMLTLQYHWHIWLKLYGVLLTPLKIIWRRRVRQIYFCCCYKKVNDRPLLYLN